MIQLPQAALEVISQRIAPANSASFIWRKLAESPTVEYWSRNVSKDDLLQSLRQILSREVLNEVDQINVYCIGVALLLQNRRLAADIKALEGVEKAFWLRPLADFSSDSVSATNEVSLTQKPRSSTDQLSVTTGSSSGIIRIGHDQ